MSQPFEIHARHAGGSYGHTDSTGRFSVEALDPTNMRPPRGLPIEIPIEPNFCLSGCGLRNAKEPVTLLQSEGITLSASCSKSPDIWHPELALAVEGYGAENGIPPSFITNTSKLDDCSGCGIAVPTAQVFLKLVNAADDEAVLPFIGSRVAVEGEYIPFVPGRKESVEPQGIIDMFRRAETGYCTKKFSK